MSLLSRYGFTSSSTPKPGSAEALLLTRLKQQMNEAPEPELVQRAFKLGKLRFDTGSTPPTPLPRSFAVLTDPSEWTTGHMNLYSKTAVLFACCGCSTKHYLGCKKTLPPWLSAAVVARLSAERASSSSAVSSSSSTLATTATTISTTATNTATVAIATTTSAAATTATTSHKPTSPPMPKFPTQGPANVSSAEDSDSDGEDTAEEDKDAPLTVDARAYLDAVVDYALREAERGADRSWVAETGIYSSHIVMPHPHAVIHHKDLKVREFAGHAVTYAMRNTIVTLADPERFSADYMPDEGIRCPGCKSRLDRHGWSRTRFVRGVGSITRATRWQRYYCTKCKRTHELPDLLGRLPPAVRQATAEFVGGKAALVDTYDVSLVVASRDAGVAFNTQAEAQKKARALNLVDMDLAMMEQSLVDRVRMQRLNKDAPVRRLTELPSSFADVFMLTRKRATTVYTQEAKRQEPTVETMLAHLSVGHGRFMMDHAFFHGDGQNILGQGSFFHVLNGAGCVVGGAAMPSKSLGDCVEMLSSIARSAVSDPTRAPSQLVMATDNPGNDEKHVKEAMSEASGLPASKIRVVDDFFHRLQDAEQGMKKGHSLFSTAMGQLANCFTYYDPADLEKLRALLLKKHPKPKVNAMMENDCYLRSNKSIRRPFRTQEEILGNVKAWRDKFEKEGLFLPTFPEMYQKIVKHVQNFGFEIADEDSPLFVNLGSEESPEWLTMRGTSQVESLHRFLRRVDFATSGVELGNFIYVRAMFNFSYNRLTRVLGFVSPRHVCDPTRLDDFARLRARLQDCGVWSVERDAARDWVPVGTKMPSFYTSPFGLRGLRPGSAAYQALLTFRTRAQLVKQAWPNSLGPELRFSSATTNAGLAHDMARILRPVSEAESPLVRAMLLRFLKTRAQASAGGSLTSAFWLALRDGRVEDLVDLDKLTMKFNSLYLDAAATVGPNVTVDYDGVSVPLTLVTPKESSHIKAFLNEYANRVYGAIHKTSVAASSSASTSSSSSATATTSSPVASTSSSSSATATATTTTTPVASAPKSTAFVAPPSIALPLFTPASCAALAVPPTFVGSEARRGDINFEPNASRSAPQPPEPPPVRTLSAMRKRNADVAAATSASASTAAASSAAATLAPPKRRIQLQRCEECGLTRHRGNKATACAFYVWWKANEKNLARRSGEDNDIDAARRIWCELKATGQAPQLPNVASSSAASVDVVGDAAAASDGEEESAGERED